MSELVTVPCNNCGKDVVVIAGNLYFGIFCNDCGTSEPIAFSSNKTEDKCMFDGLDKSKAYGLVCNCKKCSIR